MEGRLRSDATITDEQAAEISLRVKALSRLMGAESAHYQSVFAARIGCRLGGMGR